MTIYTVGSEEYFNLTDAKKQMKLTGEKGFKTKVYSNGEFVLCGEISLKGQNRCKVVGQRNCNSY